MVRVDFLVLFLIILEEMLVFRGSIFNFSSLRMMFPWVFISGLYCVEKEMATHFSILAWGIPWTEEPGGLQSMGSERVGHD